MRLTQLQCIVRQTSSWRCWVVGSTITLYQEMHDEIFHFEIFKNFIKILKYFKTPFLSASLYVSKRGAYWDRLCRDVVGRSVGCHARALWPNGAS